MKKFLVLKRGEVIIDPEHVSSIVWDDNFSHYRFTLEHQEGIYEFMVSGISEEEILNAFSPHVEES